MSETTDAISDRRDTMYEVSTNETPSETVISAVATVTDQSPLEMTPLIRVIDPDALDQLLDANGGNGSSPTVTFDYCRCQVAVTANGVQVDHPEDIDS